MDRYYTDLQWNPSTRKWVPIWKYRRWAGWKNLEDLTLICETCESLITGSGTRFCSQACHRSSFKSPLRMKLVAALQHQISTGEYQVDPLQVADAMLYWGGRTDPIRTLPWVRRRLEELQC